jgi:hypothetical protein
MAIIASGEFLQGIDEVAKGKTIESIIDDDQGMFNYIVISFKDGTKLQIRYDYIYEWELSQE